MASFNKVILMGNLTRDPELRYLSNQTAVVDIGLATTRKWMGQDGQDHEETCFTDCSIFGKRAEVINKYFKKGNPILIEGYLKFESWQAQDGSKRTKLKVMIDNFEFVGGQNQGGQQNQPQPQQGGQSPAIPEHILFQPINLL